MGSGSADRRSGGDVAFVGAVVALGGAILAWLVIGLLPALAAHVGPVRTLMAGWAGGDGWISGLSGRVLTASASADGAGRVSVDYLFSALNLALAALLVVRRPLDRVARLLTVAMIGTAATFNHQSHSLFTSGLLGPDILHDAHDLVHVVSGLAYMDAVLLFPDDKLVPRLAGRRAWALHAAYLAAHLVVIVLSLGAISESHPGQVFFVRFFGLLIPIAGVAAQTYRLRRASTPEQAQQARLLRWALLPTFAAGLVFSTAARSQLETLGLVLFPALFALIPVALLVGILRYRLWDIDVLVNRALVYATLAGFIGVVYVAVVVAVGAALGTGRGAGAVASITATALVAVAVQPARERLVRLANQVVYGQRASPTELLAGFIGRLAESHATDDVLARLARVVAEGTGALRATVWLQLGDQLVPVASFPTPGEGRSGAVANPPAENGRAGRLPALPGADRAVAVQHLGELLGVVAVTKRAGEALTPTEDELLADVASQAGLVLHNVQLAADLNARLADLSAQANELRASRQRIVAVQDAERRRLERDIHDGAQQHLVALAIQLDVAAGAVGEDPSSARAVFAELEQLTGDAVGTLRDLARGIYSPVLSRNGLVGALEAHTHRLPVPTTVVSEGVGRYPLEVETAAYFSCLEALQNVSKHASARQVVVHLSERDAHLCFSVGDDGVGFDPAHCGHGSGLTNVVERIAALGGEVEVRSRTGAGTVVTGRLPVGG